MSICTGEGLNNTDSDEISGRLPVKLVKRENRRKDGGSEMGEERAAEIAGWFEYANGRLDKYDESLLYAARVNVNRFVRSALELPGIEALKRVVSPQMFLLDPPKFRENAGEKDTLGDIRGLVKKSCEKLASLEMSRAGDNRKDVVDGEWASRARVFDENFDGVARLTGLDKKYPDSLSRIKLKPGEEE